MKKPKRRAESKIAVGLRQAIQHASIPKPKRRTKIAADVFNVVQSGWPKGDRVWVVAPGGNVRKWFAAFRTRADAKYYAWAQSPFAPVISRATLILDERRTK
jgi:hypothetical protein